jgi:hypothetical protein
MSAAGNGSTCSSSLLLALPVNLVSTLEVFPVAARFQSAILKRLVEVSLLLTVLIFFITEVQSQSSNFG